MLNLVKPVEIFMIQQTLIYPKTGNYDYISNNYITRTPTTIIDLKIHTIHLNNNIYKVP